MKMTTLIKMVKAITSWMWNVSSVDEFSKVSVDKAEKGLMGVVHDCIYLQLDYHYTNDLIIALDHNGNGIQLYRTVRENGFTKGYSYLSYIYCEAKTQIDLMAELTYHIHDLLNACK